MLTCGGGRNAERGIVVPMVASNSPSAWPHAPAELGKPMTDEYRAEVDDEAAATGAGEQPSLILCSRESQFRDVRPQSRHLREGIPGNDGEDL